jgi:hypothetical protein
MREHQHHMGWDTYWGSHLWKTHLLQLLHGVMSQKQERYLSDVAHPKL